MLNDEFKKCLNDEDFEELLPDIVDLYKMTFNEPGLKELLNDVISTESIKPEEVIMLAMLFGEVITMVLVEGISDVSGCIPREKIDKGIELYNSNYDALREIRDLILDKIFEKIDEA